MRTRMTALVLVAGLAMSGVADAAVKHKAKPKPPPCNIIKDNPSDSGPLSGAAGAPLYDPSLDILSADVATNATTITTVIRVKQLTESDSSWQFGREWSLEFTTSTGQHYALIAYDGTPAHKDAAASIGHVTLDYPRGEVRVSAKLSELPFGLPKGTTLGVLQAHAVASVQLPDSGPAGLGHAFLAPGWSTEDDAAAPVTSKYSVGAATCVKVGT